MTITKTTRKRIRWVALSLGTALGLAVLVGCLHEGGTGGTGGPPPPSPPPEVPVPVQIERVVEPAQPRVGEAITITLTVTVEQELPAVLITEILGGLALLEIEEGFSLAEEGVLKGVILAPGAGTTHTFRYRAECEDSIPYTLVTEASSKDFSPAYAITTVTCTE